MADHSKYRFNNVEYGKRRLVLAVVEQYIKDNKPDYATLIGVFPSNLQGPFGVFISKRDFDKKVRDGNDPSYRYFVDEKETLTTLDNVTIFVSNQWGIKENGKGNFNRFLNQAIALGYEIQVKNEKRKTIKELFEEYKKTPKSEWIERFEEICNEADKLKNSPPEEFDEQFLKRLWFEWDNGVAFVGQGGMSIAEFDRLKFNLADITSKIFNSPSPETLDQTYSWARSARDEQLFDSIKWGVLHRVFKGNIGVKAL
jgi:5-methylcytosine-specific restriction protein B